MKNKYYVTLIIVFLSSLLNGQNTDKLIEYKSLQDALKNPEKVYKLNLSNQDITISDEIWAKFVNLENLTLRNDKLIEFPSGIFSLKKIKYMDLSGNDFRTLPQDFSKLTNLEELYLNNEKNIDLPATLNVLIKLPKLKALHLEEDNLTALPVEILSFKNLEELYLNNNNFIEIPRLETLDHLKYLDLKDNNIKPDLQEIKNLNFGFKINF